jgi:hypothetical protein
MVYLLGQCEFLSVHNLKNLYRFSHVTVMTNQEIQSNVLSGKSQSLRDISGQPHSRTFLISRKLASSNL